MTGIFSHFSPTYLLKILNTYPTVSTVWVAYSGGVDSHVLLYALAQLRVQTFQLRAVHIQHHLHPKANDWAIHCQQVCKILSIPCQVIPVKIPSTTGESIEALAREARYAAFADCIQNNDLLLTAHHADDQVETVLLQLLRGAGVAGLAAMPDIMSFKKGWLGRPLLSFNRIQIVDYAKKEKLNWLEDPSNVDKRFDRNFLRHEIIPPLRGRWQNLDRVFNRVAHHQAEALDLLQILAEQDWQIARIDQQLSIPIIKQLTTARQRNLLRYWLKQLGLIMPSTQQLQRILDEVILAGQDRQPLVRWQGGEVHRYQNQLIAIPNLPAIPTKPLQWLIPETLILPLGKLTATRVQGGGLAIPASTILQIRFRQGGETCVWRGHHRVVKKLLQSARIPTWQRPFLPLIYDEQGHLLAIPNVAVCDKVTVQAGEFGWELGWKM